MKIKVYQETYFCEKLEWSQPRFVKNLNDA